MTKLTRPVWGWFLIICFLLGAWTFVGCAHSKPLEFRRMENFRVTQFNFTNPTVQTDVVYFNPNSVGFTFKGAVLDVYLDTLFLGHSVIDTSLHVDPNSEFAVTLPMTLDLQRLLQSGLKSYLNRKVNVRVDGTVTGSKAGIKKTFPLHYEGEQELDFNLF